MPAIFLGQHYLLQEVALGHLAASSSSSSGGISSMPFTRASFLRPTVYISLLCVWSIFLVLKGAARRQSSVAPGNCNEMVTDVVETIYTPLIQHRRQNLQRECQYQQQLEQHDDEPMTQPMEQVQEFVSIELTADITEMGLERYFFLQIYFDYVALDLPWQPIPAASDETNEANNILQDQESFVTTTAISYTNSSNRDCIDPASSSSYQDKSVLVSASMGAVESLPSVSHHDRDLATIESIGDIKRSKSASVCLSECEKQETGGGEIRSEKLHVMRRAGARSLLRASLRRYGQMAPGWARGRGNKSASNAEQILIVGMAVAVSPKRMPSAEDIGAITRTIERRFMAAGGLTVGSGESDMVHGSAAQLSASMPHLPSRFGILKETPVPSYAAEEANAADNGAIKDDAGVKEAMPVTPEMSLAEQMSPSTNVSSLLLMFPIDFTSSNGIGPDQRTLFVGQTAADAANRYGITEIRQRLARRLSRNGRHNRRRSSIGGGVSSAASPATTPTSVIASEGARSSGSVQQRKRIFMGDRPASLITEDSQIPADEARADSYLMAAQSIETVTTGIDSCSSYTVDSDELSRGLEMLTIDNCVGGDDSNSSIGRSNRLLSESIDFLLEQRLYPTSSAANTANVALADEVEIPNVIVDVVVDDGSADVLASSPPSALSSAASSISSGASSSTLSEGERIPSDTIDTKDSQRGSTNCTALNDVDSGDEMADHADVFDYEDYMYLSACGGSDDQDQQIAVSGCVMGDENAEPAATVSDASVCRGEVRSANMQYMPKLSKVFLEASRNMARDATVPNRGYMCGQCTAAGSLSHSMGSLVTLGDWFSSKSESGYTSLASQGNGYSILDYWDILSRCPMRPTSSLALSSLRAMAKASMAFSESGVHSQRFSNSVGKPISRHNSRRGGGVSDSSESESDSSNEDLEYSDDDDDREQAILHGFMTSSSSAAQLRQRGHMQGGSHNQQRGNSNGSNGKQRQKRVLSEPMQYILYNSYLRYYGRPGES
ncbi:hypothetical protein BX661DRAFT_188332 [Kickxella alabastrina]|uniref:uncharacterized protein n=1 Tax=Kickxella alabastrina TaxID=61397 RepID=UPI0022211DD7|nr:uncharacterized protein BX661DRAFT_188332 [Kickxella alabastrina]KAI7821446.1 hypothetical protein BX661DRAFT_188332 [Kickxella alabastrina]